MVKKRAVLGAIGIHPGAMPVSDMTPVIQPAIDATPAEATTMAQSADAGLNRLSLVGSSLITHL